MSVGSGLTLVTGPTGSGKTALVVSWLMDLKERPLYTMGIPELKVEHEPVPPVSDWTEMRQSEEDPALLLPYFTFPPGSVVVLDEAQRVFRPRSTGAKVPPEVQAFETRRHTGADFVLLTQAPHLLDSNLRRLVTRHVHIHDTFLGRYKLEWVGIGDPENKASRELATRERYKPPARTFDVYKSAELHTKIVRKYPVWFYLMMVIVPLAIGLVWYSYSRIKSKTENGQQLTEMSGQTRQVSTKEQKQPVDVPMTSEEYVQSFSPRVVGLPHTAPAYDEVTKVAQAPEPVGCMESKRTGCKCFTQQGTPYDTTQAICTQILASGLWMPWKQVEQLKEQSKTPVQVAQASFERQPMASLYQEAQSQPVAQQQPLQQGNDSTNPRFNVSLRQQ